ncbi:MAG: hypothetical protein QME94_13955, partial [Anaerolineae bacterium]|nr:hypothetical protein [Anaerolineae bacterium]
MTDDADLRPLERMLASWPGPEPPPALDRAVHTQARRLLAQRRAALAAEPASTYPAWLLALTASLLVAAVSLARVMPAARVAWHLAWRHVDLPPLAPLWLG